MLEVDRWLIEKQKQQSVRAIFSDAWYYAFGRECTSNKVDIDVRNFETRHVIPLYVLSYFGKERRCTIH